MTVPLVAALPMYDLPWLRDATDALWRALVARLPDADTLPAGLDRARALPELWRDPGLVFGQTCGYPYVSGLRNTVSLIATPCYGFAGCEGPQHCSLIVVRRPLAGLSLAGLRGQRLALNEADSNTGMNLLRLEIAGLADGAPFFSTVTITHAHLASLAALRAGMADVAAIDCVTHGLVARDCPELLEGTAVIGQTVLSPALPYVMNAAQAERWLRPMRLALHAVIADPANEPACARLGLTGIETLDDAAYHVIAAYEQRAQALNYPELR